MRNISHLRIPIPSALTILLLALLAIADLARAKESAGRESMDFGPKLSSVEIHDFEKEIDILLREAGDAAAGADYERATELYQEAARAAPLNYVVRVAPRTYLGAGELVKSRIAAWPEEGIATYRRLIAPRVAEILAGALERGDTRALGRIAREFPHSAEAPRAMLLLGTMALARGDLDLALRHLLEILRLYPEGPIPGVERRDVLARAGLAAGKLGDRLLLEEIRERAAKLPAEAVVAIAGEEVRLTDFLAAVEVVSPGELAPEGWAGVGGGSSRRGGRDGPTGPLARYFTIPALNPSFDDVYEYPRRRGDDHSRPAPIHPLIGSGHLIVAGHGAIRAFRLPEPGSEPAPPELNWRLPDEEVEQEVRPEARAIPVFASLAGGLLTIPWRNPDDEFYALGEMTRDFLLSIDVATGKRLDQQGRDDPTSADLPDGIEFSGAPAIANGRVYVTGFRTRHLVETFVFCFDPGGRRGGLRLRWMTSLCLGEGQRGQGIMGFPGFPGEPQRMEASSVTIRNGLAYVCSNTGAVAALEAETGEIVWLHTYEQAKRHTDLYTREVRSTMTWFPNPPMLDHRFLYVTPRDSDRLFIYHQRPDLKTGFVVHDHFGRDQIVNGFDPEYMLGVRDGVVFLAGSSRTRGERPLFAVKSGPQPPSTEEGSADQQRILWRAEIEEDAPSGRGVLAGDSIYFPTEKAVYRVAIADGAVTKLLDLSDFPDLDEPDGVVHPIGNLAVSGPWLVTAGERAVTLFGPPPDQKDESERGD